MRPSPRQTLTAPIRRSRFLWVAIFFCFWIAAIALRLSEAQLSDPGRIDHIAKQLGLDEPAPGQVVRPDGLNAGAPVLAQAQVPALTVN